MTTNDFYKEITKKIISYTKGKSSIILNILITRMIIHKSYFYIIQILWWRHGVFIYNFYEVLNSIKKKKKKITNL